MTQPELLETGVMGRSAELPRAERNGWSRNWAFGSPHYFLRGMNYALCGAGASSTVRMTQTDEPDSHVTEKERRAPCPHCIRLLKAGHKGHSR